MSPAGLTLSAILVLGAVFSASARSVFTEQAMAQAAGAPKYWPIASEQQIRAQDAEARSPMYYSPYAPGLVEVQQQRCMGTNVPVNVPFVNVDVCSVTPNQCGWVKVDVGGSNFLGISLGTRVTVDVRVCDQNGSMCYRPLANDCSRLGPLAIKVPITVPGPNGDVAVDVYVQGFPTDVCVRVHLPRCR